MTVQEYIASLEMEFSKLSASTKRAWKRKALAYIEAKPHMADASIFWRGLSARQVLGCK